LIEVELFCDVKARIVCAESNFKAGWPLYLRGFWVSMQLELVNKVAQVKGMALLI